MPGPQNTPQAVGEPVAHPQPQPSAATTAAQPPEAPYVPLTAGQKFGIYARNTYSPYSFASVLMNATYAQIVDDWPGYGQGFEGWGKRIGATYADTQARSFVQTFLLPTLLHQDPRYFPSKQKGVVPRGWYAATRVLITRHDSGQDQFNYSQVMGTLFTRALANAYYPESDRGFGRTMGRTFSALVSDAGSNVLREFWPDIKRVFRRRAPQKVKDMERKIPGGIDVLKP